MASLTPTRPTALCRLCLFVLSVLDFSHQKCPLHSTALLDQTLLGCGHGSQHCTNGSALGLVWWPLDNLSENFNALYLYNKIIEFPNLYDDMGHHSLKTKQLVLPVTLAS